MGLFFMHGIFIGIGFSLCFHNYENDAKGNKENTEISMFKRSSNKNLNELTR
jgi:hypothetical protein